MIFDQNDKVSALIATLNKNLYNSLINSLSEKYSIISKQDPFVGDKSARFKSDNTIITLVAPHMSFDLTLTYMLSDFERPYLHTIEEEQKQKSQNQTNTL